MLIQEQGKKLSEFFFERLSHNFFKEHALFTFQLKILVEFLNHTEMCQNIKCPATHQT